MATYVTVHRPGSEDHSSGPYHNMMGKIVGFAVTGGKFNHNRVLVALEDGTLATFSPPELRAGKVVYNRRPE